MPKFKQGFSQKKEKEKKASDYLDFSLQLDWLSNFQPQNDWQTTKIKSKKFGELFQEILCNLKLLMENKNTHHRMHFLRK